MEDRQYIFGATYQFREQNHLEIIMGLQLIHLSSISRNRRECLVKNLERRMEIKYRANNKYYLHIFLFFKLLRISSCGPEPESRGDVHDHP